MWELVYDSRPWTLNNERTWHYHERARLVKEWRQAFWALAKQVKVPHCDEIGVEAFPSFAKGRLCDCEGTLPAVKAAVDGLVDARVVDDDGPAFVKWITLHAATRTTDALRLVVHRLA